MSSSLIKNSVAKISTNFELSEPRVSPSSVTVTEVLNIEWPIKNISNMNDRVGFSILSPLYPSKQSPKTMWYLQFFPHGRINDKFCCINLYQKGSKTVTASCDLTFLGLVNRLRVFRRGGNFEFKDGHYCGFDEFVNSEDWKKFIINDTLTIICIIRIKKIDGVDLNILSSSNGCNKILQKPKDDIAILNKLRIDKFFNNDKFSDIKLILKEETFNVHKVILGSASPIFMELFEDLKEQKSSVDISDISSNGMREMLRYIYTGRVENLTDIVYEVAPAAHKYDIKGLKEECEKFLCHHSKPDNLMDMLTIAESYDFLELYANVCNLFVLHRNEIISTLKFKELESSNPRIISKLFVSLIENRIL